ncbi:multidrug ABC transporter ATP-binding protein [Desulfosarcina ovata subsp. sediminis]|uniref:Multidrug resistance-like ATP-binding protein MdlA n=1 Tax=Desulfosarcina ovata subsp. sediminis TaxID=885957 RepID=A0A5K8A1F5_9BACT|nr:ABC transporter ATP-binding protein [Desulfosarcina ovata]BBO86389.1 multidrug ABC transporter ATP-binding protein [Desulfosarcina ovata subsp. sediminis]
MKSYRLIQPYLMANRVSILFGLLCLIVVDFLQLFIPRVIKRVVDDLALMQVDTAGLLRYAGMILALGLCIGCFRFFWRRCLLGTARKTEEALRNRLFRHVQTLSPAYFDRVRTGDLMAHATNDIQQVRMASGMGLVALNDAIFLGSAAIGFMIYINLELTLYVLIPMPLIVIGSRYFGRHMHRRYTRVQAAFSELTEAVRERFAGIRVVMATNAQATEARAIESISEAYVQENIDLVKITGAFFPLMILLTNLSLAIVLFQGGRQTIFGRITPGDFVAFISYLGLLTWPMMALGWVTNLIQRGRASLDRLDGILSTPPELIERADARPVDAFTRHLTVDDVGFAYHPARGKVLNGIRLRLEKGQTLGIVGPPGAGKTTLLQLLMRLYDVNQGAMRIDGKDLRELKIKDLRALISVAPQEPFLFAGTIRENITFGNLAVTDAQLTRVTRLAALDATIAEMPDGLDTVVGEKGVILSGGQKQRVALARAFLNDTPILILDDPVSQVDTRTAAHIVDTLNQMAGEKTLIIVSHRLSAVRHADRIVLMEDGRITAAGTHAQMMADDAYYARAYRLQELEDAL